MKNLWRNFWSNKWLLSICSGILLGLSFPPFPFPYFQFAAFILLFRLITLSNSAKEAAYYSYAGFIIWNLLATYWLMLASLPAGIAAIIANSLLMSLVVMLQYTAQKKLDNAWLIALLQSAFWLSYEYLHHHWDLSWPWLSLGNAWSTLPPLIQYISVSGFLGISFWVMFSSALIAQANRLRKRKFHVAALALIILMPVISLIQWSSPATKSSKKVETVIAQPNFNAYKELGGLSTDQQVFNLQKRLSDSVRTSKTRLILWPENGIHPYLSNRRTRNNAAMRVRADLKRIAVKWNTTLVGGTPYFEYYTKKHHPPLPRWSGNVTYLTFNAAVGFNGNGRFTVYKKHNLVPVIERFPFVIFFNAIDIFGWIDWASIQQFGEGRHPTQFSAGSTKVPVLICYDSVYPGWVRHFVADGAGFITVITNDGWWGNTSGHVQHFDFARLRAIEFRRWIVQDSNNGTSGVIAPDGSVIKRTAFGTRTAFRFNVPVLTKQTFYTRYGDWLPVSLLVISIGGICWLVIIKLRAGGSAK